MEKSAPPARPDGAPPAIASIRFDRRKYGPPLLADACEVGSLPFFIKTARPHRLAFYEVALVTEGRGELALDGVAVEVAPYRVCVTAPGEVRSWQLAGARLEGRLAFFEAELFEGGSAERAFMDELPIATAPAGQRSIGVDRRRFDTLAGIVDAMADELRAPDADTPRMLRAQACQLMITLQRLSGVASSPPRENRGAVMTRRFARLVEEHFRDGEPVARYAERLGVTARHLNHCVRERTGLTAGETIRRRVFLEARRRLLAGASPVAAIGEALGFSDTPYFIRFFKRHAGVTPGEFRVARGSPVFDRLSPLSASDG
ncbi:MAG: AraC family transcriptional regulator [Pseudomonadota bacterium]|nr:AraC family transcriptional regulator [Pseudomonadota bacterium]